MGRVGDRMIFEEQMAKKQKKQQQAEPTDPKCQANLQKFEARKKTEDEQDVDFYGLFNLICGAVGLMMKVWIALKLTYHSN